MNTLEFQRKSLTRVLEKSTTLAFISVTLLSACAGSTVSVGAESLATGGGAGATPTPEPSANPNTGGGNQTPSAISLAFAKVEAPKNVDVSQIALLAKLSGSNVLAARNDGIGVIVEDSGASPASSPHTVATNQVVGTKFLAMSAKEFWVLSPAIVGRSTGKVLNSEPYVQRVGIENLRGSAEALTPIGLSLDFLITKTPGKLQIFRFFKERLGPDNIPIDPAQQPFQVTQLDWPPKSATGAQDPISAGLLENSSSIWIATSDSLWVVESKVENEKTSYSTRRTTLKFDGLDSTPKSIAAWFTASATNAPLGKIYALTSAGIYATSAAPVVQNPTDNPTKLAFADIKPLVDKSCASSGCHTAGGTLNALTNEAEWKSGKPRIESRLSAGTMPPSLPGKEITSDERAKLLKWLSQN